MFAKTISNYNFKIVCKNEAIKNYKKPYKAIKNNLNNFKKKKKQCKSGMSSALKEKCSFAFMSHMKDKIKNKYL